MVILIKEGERMRIVFFSLFLVFILFYSGVSLGVGGGEITFKPQKARKVVFSHDVHVQNSRLTCVRCHLGLYRMTKGMDKPATMAEMNQGKSCGACHDGKDAFTVKENCSRCHR
jgi:c(7)-type cytochrome triheme protein